MVIEVGKFAKLKNDTLLEHGFAKGDMFFIAGNGFVPDSKADPYKYRLMFIGAPVKDGHVTVEKGFTVDGKNLKLLPKKEEAKLQATKEEDFGGNQQEETKAI